jgi:hypothetical protein
VLCLIDGVLQHTGHFVLMSERTEFVLAGMLLIVVVVTTFLQYYQLRKSMRMMDRFRANLPTQC